MTFLTDLGSRYLLHFLDITATVFVFIAQVLARRCRIKVITAFIRVEHRFDLLGLRRIAFTCAVVQENPADLAFVVRPRRPLQRLALAACNDDRATCRILAAVLH